MNKVSSIVTADEDKFMYELAQEQAMRDMEDELMTVIDAKLSVSALIGVLTFSFTY